MPSLYNTECSEMLNVWEEEIHLHGEAYNPKKHLGILSTYLKLKCSCIIFLCRRIHYYSCSYVCLSIYL